jgi:phage/plasmid primase-like uncharacterized protein
MVAQAVDLLMTAPEVVAHADEQDLELLAKAIMAATAHTTHTALAAAVVVQAALDTTQQEITLVVTGESVQPLR